MMCHCGGRLTADTDYSHPCWPKFFWCENGHGTQAGHDPSPAHPAEQTKFFAERILLLCKICGNKREHRKHYSTYAAGTHLGQAYQCVTCSGEQTLFYAPTATI